MKIVTVEQMKALEAASVEAGVSVDALMERAGLAVASEATRRLESPRGARVLVLVGSGNNGGDGLVAALHLHQWGARVQVYLCGSRKQPDPKLALVEERGIPVATASDDEGYTLLQRSLEPSPLVIDAVLGTGAARPIEGTVKEVLECVGRARSQRRLTLLAIDLPTGLDADTGTVDPSCLDADVTVALGQPKVGHYTFPGASVTGELQTVDIGMPRGLDAGVKLELITADLVRGLVPRRPLEAHKGTFGRLLSVVGSRRYPGAAVLACSGAYRAGAGLVTLAAPESVDAMAVPRIVETTHLPLPERDGGVAPEAAAVVQNSLEGYAALLIGCGLSNEPQVEAFLQTLLFQEPPPNLPMVLDADALNILAGVPDWWKRLKAPAVLTPHPGEMARLTGGSTAQVQASRLDSAREAARRWGQVVTLKGAFTVVASPEGTTRLSPFANPALASAGTGDVLAGVIGGLLAQGLSPLDAATCGVYLHGAAAEELRAELGDAGMIASDLLPEIPRRMKALASSQK